MAFKMASIVFTMIIILALVRQTSTGPAVAIVCYWTCMAACTAGAGAFAGLMTGGVGTAAGVVYGAAACATTCSAIGGALVLVPTP
jgi:hypothetical protein